MTAIAQQRDTALQRAHKHRRLRAKLKRDIRSGALPVVSVLADPPDFIATMTVLDLLLAVPGYGRTKALLVLSRCAVSPVRPVGVLTDRQRGLLAAALSGFGR